MTLREKTILLLAAASLAYGAYEVFWNPAGSRGRDSADPAEPLAGFINRISAESAAGRLSAAEIQTIQQAKRSWTDRFQAPSLPPPVFDQPPVYSGFIQMEGRKMAIVDGREYAVGERLEHSGYQVKEIAPDRIVIGGEGRRDIPIPLFELDRNLSP
jgi:hypothetical protein